MRDVSFAGDERARRRAGWAIALVLLFSARSAAADGRAYVQIIHASLDPDLHESVFSVADVGQVSPSSRTLAKLHFGESTGYVAVAPGAHFIVVCGQAGKGSCYQAGGYDLPEGASSTFVLIGGREDAGGDADSGTWDVRLVETSASSERSWQSTTGRRVAFLNGIVASPELELCLRSGARSSSPFVAAGPQDPAADGGLYGTRRATTFAVWAGEGNVDDDNAFDTNGRYRDLAATPVTLELRSYADNRPCSGSRSGSASLGEGRGIFVVVAVGRATAASRRELLVCSEPASRSASHCSRHALR